MAFQFGKRRCAASTTNIENRGIGRQICEDLVLQNAIGMGIGRKEAIYLILNG